ncbi:MAG: LacI family DNA-binding transcriptional regulator [Anaerolineae bacterium]
MPTIKDVARRARVSTATVSYVLNNTAPISEQTRARVLQAVKELGYRPSITARNLRANESRIIGYAWHSTDDPDRYNFILSRFIHYMATTAAQHEYHVMTFTHSRQETLDVYVDLIETGRVDGFVVSDTVLNDERIRFLMDKQFPFVAFGRANPEWDFPYVDVDGRDGTRQATAHLLQQGHTRIAFLGWPSGSLAGDHRLSGYVEAMADAGLAVDPDWIQRGHETASSGFELTERLLALPATRRPTAIVAVSDMMAIGAMRAVTAAGLRVGPDIAITGFDDSALVEHLQPPLTSVRQPLRQVAEKLVEMLIRQVTGELLAEHRVLLRPELVVRESSVATG